MQFKLNKKRLKNLSDINTQLSSRHTPRINGGTGSWPIPATTSIRERKCGSDIACQTLPALMCQPDYSRIC